MEHVNVRSVCRAPASHAGMARRCGHLPHRLRARRRAERGSPGRLTGDQAGRGSRRAGGPVGDAGATFGRPNAISSIATREKPAKARFEAGLAADLDVARAAAARSGSLSAGCATLRARLRDGRSRSETRLGTGGLPLLLGSLDVGRAGLPRSFSSP